ncbi:MAG: pyruvate kinase [Bacilli bacterium]|nr:pyruvate kinase [Bacilli bacterium]
MNFIDINKKTKIIATIGPASDTYEKILHLVKNGANIFRLNFSHGNYEEHLKRIKIIHEINEKNNIFIPIILDTKGPEIRIGKLKNNEVFIKKNSTFIICFENILGTEKKISINCHNFFEVIKEKELIKIDDGNFIVKVIKKDFNKKELIVQACNDYLLKNGKNVSAPKQKIKMNFISESDKNDLIFACKNNIDYIAASFTSKSDDIKSIRKILKENNKPNIQIIAKIENTEALKNINEIIKEADGIMVARGDLGLKIPLEKVPIYQKNIIKRCRQLGKPVIVATQMLNSMQFNPQPTRAEISDIFMAVNESADAIMLSGETASGLFPCESVTTQKNIAIIAEKFLNYKLLIQQAYETSKKNDNDAIANSIGNATLLIQAKIVIVFTNNKNTIQRISKIRPFCPIICVTSDKEIALKNGLYWGVYFFVYNRQPQNLDDIKNIVSNITYKLKIKKNSPIIVAFGLPVPSTTNFMHITYAD